jgi:hypothetical protein
MLGVVFDATEVLISLMVISMAEDAAMGVTRSELLAEITVGVLIHFLIMITAAIAVVVSMTTTTSVSSITITIIIVTTAATALRVD